MSETKDQNEAACGGSALTAELGADFDNAEERYLRETIAILHESYTKAAKPYVDRLASIYALRPAPRMLVTEEQAEAMGFKVPNASGKPITEAAKPL